MLNSEYTQLNINKSDFSKLSLTVKRKRATASCLSFKSNIKNKNSKNQFNIFINNKIFYSYFKSNLELNKLMLPLKFCFEANQYKIYFFIQVKGGGYSSQVSTCVLAISKILSYFFTNSRPILKKYLLLRHDSRKKERKKYGLKKARKAPQYTKR